MIFHTDITVVFQQNYIKLQGDLRAALQYVKGGCKKEGNRILSGVCCDKGKWFQTERGNSDWIYGKKFFAIKIVKHWSMLPSEVVEALSLEMLKVKLYGAMRARSSH